VVGTDGVLYTSIQAANTGNIPASSPSFWVGTSAAAAASASAALASELAAAASEAAAAISESNAAASELAAGISEANALASEQAAALSESNAAGSASSALSSANSAAATYDLFDDRYLGAKASDPTLDNDGNPLVTGAMYFNTVTNTTRIYNGVGWQDSAAVATIINLASQVTGTLPVANGGTNLATLGTAGQALVVNSGATGLEYASISSLGSDLFLWNNC
jgi:hypothetical protein